MNLKESTTTETSIGQHNSTYNMCVDNTCFIDWLSFSLKEIPIEIVIEEIIGLDLIDFLEDNKFKQGYTRSYKHQHLEIYIHENLNISNYDMGIFVEIKGSACCSIQDNLFQICSEVYNNMGKFVRVDVAIDDHEGLLDINKVDMASTTGAWTGKFRKTGSLEERNNKAQSLGKTTYFGSRKSNIFLRIYDKGKQQKIVGHWLRCELEFKKGHAQNVIELLVTGTDLGEIFYGVLKDYLTFKVSSTDSNKSRWKTESWWEDFLSDAKKMRIAPSNKIQSDEIRYEWLGTSCSKALYEMYEEIGPASILLLLTIGKEKSFQKRQRNVSTTRTKLAA